MNDIKKEQEVVEKSKILAIKAEVYSRVVGYYRPVQDWHEGKREEFNERNSLTSEELKK